MEPQKTQINVALAPDDNYAKHCCVTMASVIANASEDSDVNFFILDGGISPENKEKLGQIEAGKPYNLTFLPISQADFAGFPSSGYISVNMWYRLKISTLVPDFVKRVLYLDCDVIVEAPLDELFKMDMQGCLVAGSRDCIWKKFNKNKKFHRDYPYFNSGVLVMDVEAWRREGVEQMIFKFLSDDPSKLKHLDQTVLNMTLGNRLLTLGIKWNFQYTPPFLEESCYLPFKAEYRAAKAKPCIIHYVGIYKPWIQGYSEFHIMRSAYFKNLALTPWRFESADGERKYHEESRAMKTSAFFKVLWRNVKRKPWFIFKPYFWQRFFI